MTDKIRKNSNNECLIDIGSNIICNERIQSQDLLKTEIEIKLGDWNQLGNIFEISDSKLKSISSIYMSFDSKGWNTFKSDKSNTYLKLQSHFFVKENRFSGFEVFLIIKF